MEGIIAASLLGTFAKTEALPIRSLGKSLGRALALSCLLLTIPAGCTPPSGPPDPVEEGLLQDFRAVAYRTERPVLGNDGQPRPRRDYLAKWTLPVRAALIAGDTADTAAPLPPAFRQMAAGHLAELAGLTGLDIAAATVEDANLLIFLADDPFAAARRHHSLFAHKIADRRRYDALLARMETSATCFGFVWGGWPSGRSIDFAVAFIRSDRGQRTVRGCLVQEVTQVFGLMNDLAPTADSVFSDSGRQVDLTDRDRLMIRLLYDPNLRPGMGWVEVEPLVRSALRDLREEELR